MLLASLVPLSGTLGAALRTGTAVRRLHGEAVVLGVGWTGKIEHVPDADVSTGPRAWELSLGPTATIRLRPDRQAVSLELAPVGCRSERLALGAPGARPGQSLQLRIGFHWYTIGLAFVHDARRLTLSARCAVPTTPLPTGTARPLAVAIAGLAWTDGP
ncbi:MAG: hypothetical protein ABSD85_01230 [Acidimicrobiales bacterium]